MRYEGKLYRPPSESDAYILQATIGCSWNHCTYCDMYRDKHFYVRELVQSLADVEHASSIAGDSVTKVFVADGDALVMELDSWLPILEAARFGFPQLRRVSCYAMAGNVLAKGVDALSQLREAGLTRLYIGPESGDDVTLKRIGKRSTFDDHVAAAEMAHEAGMEISVIGLLGAGGVDRSTVHAEQTARLVTEMDPAFFAALTLTVVPGPPIWKQQASGRFVLPDRAGLLRELRTMVALACPTDALFRTNHASNYLALGGRIPRDNDRIVSLIDAALAGRVPLRPEQSRGL